MVARSVFVAIHFLGILLVALLFVESASAQVTVDDLLLLVERTGEEVTPELVVWLEDLLREPLDLRSATLEELAALPGISPQTAGALFDGMRGDEVFVVDDLTALIGADPDLILLLGMITHLDPVDRREPFRLEIRSRVEFDLQRRRGFRDTLRRIVAGDTIDLGNVYLGPPGAITTRLLGSVDGWGFGAVVDRDPGEPLLYIDTLGYLYRSNESVDSTVLGDTGRRHGTGIFLSGHLTRSLGPVDLVLGDYSVQIAHGLLFGRSFGGRKGGTPTRDPFGGTSRVRPWRSRTEFGYLRGLALSIPIDTLFGVRVGGLAFLSQRFLDGSIAYDPANPPNPRISVDGEGLLASRTDIRRDDQIFERVAGGRGEIALVDGVLGGTVAVVSRSSRLEQEVSEPALVSRDELASLDLRWRSAEVTGSGEIGLANGKPGLTLASGFGRASLDATLAVRYFAPGFSSPYGVTFAESPGSPGGETGLYMGARFRPVRGLGCEIFLDLYSREDPDPRVTGRLEGSDGMARVAWNVAKGTRIEGTIRMKREDESQVGVGDDGRELSVITPTVTVLARLVLRHAMPNEPVRLRLRIEHRTRDATFEETRIGTLLYLDGSWNPHREVTLHGGLGLFHGSTPPEPVYAHEYSLPGGVSLPSLSGLGRRYYLAGLWHLSERLSLGMRFEETAYSDRDVISPGSPRGIDGNRQSSLALQADWRLGVKD